MKIVKKDFDSIVFKRETKDGSYPSFLGFNENNELCWIPFSYDEIISEGYVHKLWTFENYHPIEVNGSIESEEAGQFIIGKRSQMESIAFSFAYAGLTPRVLGEREYVYYFTEVKADKHILKEMGYSVEKIEDLTDEQFDELRTKLWDPRYNADDCPTNRIRLDAESVTRFI